MRHCLPLVGAHGRAPLHAMGKFRRHGPLFADHVVYGVRSRNGALQRRRVRYLRTTSSIGSGGAMGLCSHAASMRGIAAPCDASSVAGLAMTLGACQGA